MTSTYPNPPKHWKKSWKGLEYIKTDLVNIAHEVVRTDSIVRSMYPSSVSTGLIMEAMRDSQLARCPEIKAAADAQNKLYDLHFVAVWTHHLEFDFARAVWNPILDPIHG